MHKCLSMSCSQNAVNADASRKSFTGQRAMHRTLAVRGCLGDMQRDGFCTWQNGARLPHSGQSYPHSSGIHIYSQRIHGSADQCRRLKSLPCSTLLSRSPHTALVAPVPTAHHHVTMRSASTFGTHFAGTEATCKTCHAWLLGSTPAAMHIGLSLIVHTQVQKHLECLSVESTSTNLSLWCLLPPCKNAAWCMCRLQMYMQVYVQTTNIILQA